MSYLAIPTRTSASVASSADVNQTQENITSLLSGVAPFNQVATPANPATDKVYLYFKSDNKLYKKTSAGTELEVGAGGAKPNYRLELPAGSMNREGIADPADLITLIGTNLNKKAEAFDSATTEYLYTSFEVPDDIATSGNITFSIWGVRATGSSGNIVFNALSINKQSGDSWDDATSGVASSSGAKTPTGDGKEDKFTWTLSISTSTWTAGDTIDLYLARDISDGADTLSGDYNLTNFLITIPRV